jgi:hypothetical protein
VGLQGLARQNGRNSQLFKPFREKVFMVSHKRRLVHGDKKALRGKRLVRYMSVLPVEKMTDLAMLSSYVAGLKETLVGDTEKTLNAIRIGDKLVKERRKEFKRNFGVAVHEFPWAKMAR